MQQSVCILCVKTMRDMTAKLQDGYKNNAMYVNPKHNRCMKKILVKQKFLSQFRSIEQQVRLIENLEKSVF